MKRHQAVVLLFALADASCSHAPADNVPLAGTTVVRMEDCDTTRPGRIGAVDTDDSKKSKEDELKALMESLKPQKLVKRGAVTVDGQTYTFYLPKAKAYRIKNTGGDSALENNSTLISIDQDGDGKLADDEGWYANQPIRLGDKMVDVVEIAADGSQIVLRPSKSPLAGVIRGRSCPPFAWETADGKRVTPATYAGKVLILDIWSIT